MTTGEIIRAKREEKGITGTELAARIGVTHSMVSQIERGSKAVSLPLAAQIAEAFGCTVDDLINSGQ